MKGVRMPKKSSPIIKVFIDSSEKSFVKKSKMFIDEKKIYNEIKPLEDGDLKILLQTKEFLTIERKRYDDFVSSYVDKNKHLQDQAIRMNQNCQHYCCIIHGSFDDVVRASRYNPSLKRVKESTVTKIHQKMEMVYKLPCFFVETDIQYFQKVYDIAQMLVKASGMNTIVKSSVQVEERPDLSMLMAKRGIGDNIAEVLIDEFGSPKNVLYASRDDLLKIDGVGEGTVLKIKELKEIFENGEKTI